MKKLNLKSLVAVVGLLFCLSPVLSHAQPSLNPPYTINNLINCSVTIKWEGFNGSPCNTSCGTSGTATIIAGGFFNIPPANFAGCGGTGPCSIKITILTVNGTSIGNPFIKGPSTDVPFSSVSGCTGMAPSMHWTGAGVDINP